MIKGDSLVYMSMMEDDSFDLVLTDPPYSTFPLINDSIREARRVSKGASLYFMYADDIFDLEQRPDQILFWNKPPSTKNTIRRYSRFTEVIACYDLDRSPFNQDTHWTSRSGTFSDSFAGKIVHPFQKPISLLEKLLVVNSSPGDWVLDPFAGSCSVERACMLIDRHCLSIEIK